MRKFIVCLLIILLTGASLGSVQGQSAETPADLLPAGTLVYVEMPGGELPSDIDTLIGLLAPPGLDVSAEELLSLTPYADAADWIGDRVALGLYSTFDLQSNNLLNTLPTAAIIIGVADEDAADAFLQDQGWRQGQVNSSLHIWTQRDEILPVRILRTPGFMVLGTGRGIRAVLDQLQSPGLVSLADDAGFANVSAALSPNPIVWTYAAPFEAGLAFYASDNALSIETLMQGPIPPGGVPAALNPDALEGVPINAIFVDAGMNADITLQTTLNGLRVLLLGLSQMDEDLALLPLQFELGLQDALGVNVDQELIPLFDGGYAAYVASNLGATVEGGLILAPNNAVGLPDILARLTGQLAESADLNIIKSGDAEFTLSAAGDLFAIVAGAQNDRLYVANELGADSILIALDDGPNILESSRWARALEAAPPGAQHVSYLNARELLDLLIISMQRNPDSNQETLAQAITYAKRFESAAMFQRSDANGVHLMRFVLLFN